ncbi:hypothetical protein [Flavobacterium sp.]|uniref:hypothetical protein n=1 Tax=Flavobacterium sp. TaxID=239 RepID=UPI00263567BB|nr:hypothetical protein [Flavobacterium sp.]
MKKVFLVLTFLLCSLSSSSQNIITHRAPFVLKLAVDEEGYYEMNVDKTPYFPEEKLLQIFPSEKLYIEVEIKSDTIYKMDIVKKILYPERTIEIEFIQKNEDRNAGYMELKVKNPFNRELKYQAHMYIVKHDEWIKTSIIPVYPNLLGIEIWNDVIISLLLHDWELN